MKIKQDYAKKPKRKRPMATPSLEKKAVQSQKNLEQFYRTLFIEEQLRDCV